jgi:hypothetical protein
LALFLFTISKVKKDINASIIEKRHNQPAKDSKKETDSFFAISSWFNELP